MLAAVRYALAPACIGVAVLLHVSPAGPYLHPTGLLLLGVAGTAWFGGLGPALLAALLATLVLPRLMPMSYPLLADLFDLPHFMIFSTIGAALGWGSARRRLAERSRADQAVRVAEDALRLSEERHALALEASDEGHFDADLEKGEMFVSARLNEIFGFPRRAETANRLEYLSRMPVHPDDRHLLAEVTRPVPEERGQDVYEFEFRIVPRPGEIRWIHTRGKVVRDAEGRARRRVGMVADITERKLAADELRESEARFRGLTDLWSDWYWQQDEHLRFTYSSAATNPPAGYPGGVAVGKTRWELPGIVPLSSTWAEHREVLAARKPFRDFEYSRPAADGTLRYVSTSGTPIFDEKGEFRGYYGVARDITERKHAVEVLRESETRARTLVELNSSGYWEQDENLRFIPIAFPFDISGYPTDERVGKTRWELSGDITPLSGSWREHQADLAAHRPFRDFEMRRVRANGQVGYYSVSGAPIFDREGRFKGYYGVSNDITKRKRIEEALRESEKRYERVMLAADAGFWEWDVAKDEFYASPRLVEMSGLAPGTTFAGREDFMRRVPFHPEDRDRWQQAVKELFASERSRVAMEVRYSRNGEAAWVRLDGMCFRDAAGRVLRWTGSATEITERKRAEEELRESQERYALAMEAASDGHADWNLETGEFYISPRLLKILGHPPDATFTGRDDWARPFHPDDRKRWEAAIAAHFASKDPKFSMDLRIVVNGETRWVAFTFIATRNAAGKVVRWTGSIADINHAKLAEEALRESQERYALAVAGSNDGIWDWDLLTGRMFVSERAQRIFGLDPGTTERLREEWHAMIAFHPEDHRAQRRMVEEYLSGALPHNEGEWRIRSKDGGYRWIRIRSICLRNSEGKPVRMAGSVSDIDAQKKAEAKLRQAQRLESMGTMAGGIAHDFNNILGVIVGYGEMALRGAKKDARLRRDLDAIMSAGERGRALVDRILAFSRSGVGERVPVHVEEVVGEALEQLAAKLPGNVTIAPSLRAGRAAMLGDSTQVHQVVMNLANNAAQAMPDGGAVRVTLEALRLEAARSAMVGTVAQGDYIVLKVSDAGTGIAPKVLEHMFDPFFTTKEIGVGTGLGLSLVHGIVVSVGGAIDVATELGKGSTFTVYLPQSGDAPAKVVHDERPLPRGKGQRVLVVDDEEPLVRLATETLAHLGYAPVPFTSSTAALAAFRADPGRFDAVLTDERMPGLSGTALIREVRGIRGAIPVVLMSGYLGMEAPAASVVVRKPLSAGELAASLARALHP